MILFCAKVHCANTYLRKDLIIHFLYESTYAGEPLLSFKAMPSPTLVVIRPSNLHSLALVLGLGEEKETSLSLGLKQC